MKTKWPQCGMLLRADYAWMSWQWTVVRTQEGQGQDVGPQVLCLVGCLPGKGDLGMSGPGVVSGALGLGGRLAAEASGEVMGEMWKGLNLERRLSEE